ncbi:MAG: MBOAT family O-acyltransferase [Bacteroidota bacterium]
MAKTNEEGKRKLLMGISLAINLGVLGFFKYFNFFIDSFVDMMGTFGMQMNTRSINIILPVGISFYTFQTLSYTIDIYRKQLKPTENIISFFAFVSFFPQLVAGPIERASQLLPQFEKERSFDLEKAIDGSRQILWGFFKKIVIADSCATVVDAVFNNYTTMSTLSLLIGAILFSFQIYGDFSGYSDIAIGTARLFGFNLMQNFNMPYFARDIGEFWRRWHISLSTWFRDYLYIPLGGSRGSKWMKMRNVIIIFTVSGFWHGANWTFVVWGFLNGLYYIPLMLFGLQFGNKGSVVAQGKLLPSFKEILMIGSTYFMTIIAWIFFRAQNVGEAFNYIGRMFTNFKFSLGPGVKLEVFLFIGLMLIFEWLQREEPHGFKLKKIPIYVRWAIYGLTTIFIFKFFTLDKSFIYFAF